MACRSHRSDRPITRGATRDPSWKCDRGRDPGVRDLCALAYRQAMQRCALCGRVRFDAASAISACRYSRLTGASVIHSRRTFLIGAAGEAPALGASRLAFPRQCATLGRRSLGEDIRLQERRHDSGQGEIPKIRRWPSMRGLPVLSGQADRRRSSLFGFSEKARGLEGMVQCVDEEGVARIVGHWSAAGTP
jgi:hypothetical protein